MTDLLEQALQKIGALPDDEQNAIASEILESLADQEAWKIRFATTREHLRQLAQQACQEDKSGETRTLDDLL
jgi:hypothetical protein